VKNSKD